MIKKKSKALKAEATKTAPKNSAEVKEKAEDITAVDEEENVEAFLRSYEVMVILPPDITEKETHARLGNIKSQIEARGGVITHEDLWGKRDFTYCIKRYESGFYAVINFNFPPLRMGELMKVLRLDTSILRFLLLQTPLDYRVFVFEEDQDLLKAEIKKKEVRNKRDDKVVPKVVAEKEQPEEKKAEPIKKFEHIAEPTEEKIIDSDKSSKKKTEKVVAKKVMPPEEPKKEEDETPVKKEESDDKRLKELDEKLDKLLSSDDF
jgi:small subunit ribosomal protein S6